MPYTTVAQASRFHLDPIKGSRFIADVIPVQTEAEAMEALERVRAELSDAGHHCWAFHLHTQQRARSSDDGEPGGSAGRPILAQIQGHGIEDVLVVVTRWFGGVKLGVGGLIRAYGGCAGKALDAAETQVAYRWMPACITHGYDDTASVESLVASDRVQRGEATYSEHVALQVSVRADHWAALEEQLIERTGGRARLSHPE